MRFNIYYIFITHFYNQVHISAIRLMIVLVSLLLPALQIVSGRIITAGTKSEQPGNSIKES